MAKLRVHNLSVSLDGYAAGPDQTLAEPLGVRGEDLHEWMFAALDGGGDERDRQAVAARVEGAGATIMGRNMFGPVRGAWPEEGVLADWKGWWGDDPPYHHDVYVLTHHAHPDIPMEGGTTFRFVTDGIEVALERAVEAAGGEDVILGGGASTIQRYLRAGLVDEMHVAIVPILLGGGERLLDNLDGAIEGYRCTELVSTPAVVHARFERAGVD
jgi:dihydrofolate reductase